MSAVKAFSVKLFSTTSLRKHTGTAHGTRRQSRANVHVYNVQATKRLIHRAHDDGNDYYYGNAMARRALKHTRGVARGSFLTIDRRGSHRTPSNGDQFTMTRHDSPAPWMTLFNKPRCASRNIDFDALQSRTS